MGILPYLAGIIMTGAWFLGGVTCQLPICDHRAPEGIKIHKFLGTQGCTLSGVMLLTQWKGCLVHKNSCQPNLATVRK